MKMVQVKSMFSGKILPMTQAQADLVVKKKMGVIVEQEPKKVKQPKEYKQEEESFRVDPDDAIGE